jgi:archaea-specific DNA-binding protein
MDMLIGNRDTRKYLKYALETVQNTDNMVLKARGKAISRAVELAEILKSKLPTLAVSNIAIDTAIVKDRYSEKQLRISTIEIALINNKAT